MKRSRIIASALTLALTVTSVCVQTGEADAAKKVSLSKKTNVTVGKTKSLKLKNGSKKAKVTWKSSKTKIAKVTKKTTKGNAATKIKGIKKGTAKITASYKLGKKKAKKYTCNVTVKNADISTPKESAAPTQPAGPVVSNPPIVSSQPTGTPAQTKAPTRTTPPPKTPTPTPTTKPTPSPDIQIYKIPDELTVRNIVVDGEIDTLWDFAPEHAIEHWTPDEEGKTAQTSNAYAKILWNENYVYIMVEAEDPEIDGGNEADYLQDSIEIFVDEHDNKEQWGSSNEFQYRTVIKGKKGGLTDKTFWNGKDIKTAVKVNEAKEDSPQTYVVEFAIPLNEAPVLNEFIGIEVQINDAQGGERNGTWNLFANPAGGDDIPYDSTLVFGDCQYDIKRAPKEITLNFSDPDSTNMELPDQFSQTDEKGNYPYYDEDGNVVCTKEISEKGLKITYRDASGKIIDKPVGNKRPLENYATMNTEARYDSENGLVYCKTANNIVIYFPDDRRILLGEKAKIAIGGTYTVEEGSDLSDGETVFRTWLVDTEDKKLTGDYPVTVSNQLAITYQDVKTGEFMYVGDLETIVPNKSSDLDEYLGEGIADAIMIKAPTYNTTIGDLVLKSVVLTVYEPVIPDEPDEPALDPLPDLDTDAGEVSGQALAVKTNTAVTVDGEVDDAWDLADYVKVGYYSSGTPSETEAQAKFMWDADNLYVLAVVKDPEIDASAADADNYKRDGVEIFLDEDNSKEETYRDNSDAFQYRFTGFTQNADGDWLPALTKDMTTNKGAEANYEITSAYKVYDGGYVVEMAIPFKNAPDIATKDTLGFELTVMDCKGGQRKNEIWLTGTGEKLPSDGKYEKEKMYENPSYFGEVKLVELNEEAGE